MTDPTSCDAAGSYCERCDLLVGLAGFHVTDVKEDDGQLKVMIESAPTVMGCPVCGVVAHGHGRTVAELVDAPCSGGRCGCDGANTDGSAPSRRAWWAPSPNRTRRSRWPAGN